MPFLGLVLNKLMICLLAPGLIVLHCSLASSPSTCFSSFRFSLFNLAASKSECGSAINSSISPTSKITTDIISSFLFEGSSGEKFVGLNGYFFTNKKSSPLTPIKTIAVPTICDQSQIENDDITGNIYYKVSLWYSSITAVPLAGYYNFTHRPFWEDSSTAASTRWFFRPSSKVGWTGLPSTQAFTKSATT